MEKCPICLGFYGEEEEVCPCGLMVAKSKDGVHVRLVSNGGKKTATLVQGLDNYVATHLINAYLNKWRDMWACGGDIMNDSKTDPFTVRLQGNHGVKIKEYLVKHNLVDSNKIFMHGL